jgi:hypothetical protein
LGKLFPKQVSTAAQKKEQHNNIVPIFSNFALCIFVLTSLALQCCCVWLLLFIFCWLLLTMINVLSTNFLYLLFV